MNYINESLHDWLLGKSEIDEPFSMLPPPKETCPQPKLTKSQITQLNKKLSSLGYEIKTVRVLKKKK